MSFWDNSNFEDSEDMNIEDAEKGTTEEQMQLFSKDQAEELEKRSYHLKGKDKEALEWTRNSMKAFIPNRLLEDIDSVEGLLQVYQEQQDRLSRRIEEVRSWAKEKGYTDDEIGELTFKEAYEQMQADKGEKPDIFSIEKLEGIIPEKHIIPNNKLANQLTNEQMTLDGGGIDLTLEVNKHNKIVTPVTINYEDDAIKINDKDKRFTPYDRSVYNAVCSLYEAGNELYTADQVYRCMNGLNGKESVSPQGVGAVTRSIDKMRRISATVDYTQEMQGRKKDDQIKKFEIEGFIINADKVRVEAGGYEVGGYRMTPKPILYEYAQATGQVLTVPRKLLNTKGVINNTTESIVIKNYLIRRIEVMKNHKNKTHSNKILFESIFKEIGHVNPSKDKTKRVRETIQKLLEKYKNDGYIKAFKFYKSGRAFKGIDIIY